VAIGGATVAAGDDRVRPAAVETQFVLARSYRASSWSRLVAVCDLIEAIRRDDLDAIRALALANPELPRATAPDSGWGAAMTQAGSGLELVVA